MVDSEMMAIKCYMRDNRIPWKFLRIAFEMGVVSYLSLMRSEPSTLPMPFRMADGSPNQGDGALCMKRDEFG